MPCICLHMIALYLLFLPPYSSIDPATAADDTVAEHDYYLDDQSLATELPGKQCPIPSPRYHLSIYILFVALGIDAATLYSYWIA